MGAAVGISSGVVEVFVAVRGLPAAKDASFPAALVAARVAGVCVLLAGLVLLELLILQGKVLTKASNDDYVEVSRKSLVKKEGSKKWTGSLLVCVLSLHVTTGSPHKNN